MTITEQLINHLMYNTLTVGIYGMIESRKKTVGMGMTGDLSSTTKHAHGTGGRTIVDHTDRLRELEK